MPEQSEQTKPSLEELLAGIWSRREIGIKLPVDADPLRPITHEDLEYLCNYHYPFLQIMNVDATFEEEVTPELVSLPNGWVIFDYADAMCSSFSTKNITKEGLGLVRQQLIEEKKAGDNGEGDEGDGGDDGSGTIIRQQFDVAMAMLKEAQTKGWAAVEIIAGNTMMQFYAWVAAQELGMNLFGFTPTAEQKKHYKIMNLERAIHVPEFEHQELSPE